MKTRYLLAVVLLLAGFVRADVEVTAVPVTVGGGGGATFTGGAVTTPILAADGTNVAPSYSFSGLTSLGFYRSGSSLVLAASSADIWWTGASAITMRSNGAYMFSSGTTVGSAADVILRRSAAATLQLGSDANGAAVAQTIKAHDGVTGTDIAGANLTVAGGRGTGAGTVSDVILQTGTALATGTTAQSLVSRHHAEGGFRALTDATATTVFTVTTGNDVACSGTAFITVEAQDAANVQATRAVVSWAAVDATAGAGGEACSSGLIGTNVSAASSGTLTVTTDATTGTDLCNIRVTATGSLTETVGPRARYTVMMDPGSSTCAINPQ